MNSLKTGHNDFVLISHSKNGMFCEPIFKHTRLLLTMSESAKMSLISPKVSEE